MICIIKDMKEKGTAGRVFLNNKKHEEDILQVRVLEENYVLKIKMNSD